MTASHVLQAITVLVLLILSPQECALQAHIAQVEAQHPLSLMLLRVTMLSKDQQCRFNARLEHTVILVKLLYANHVILENIVLT
jgi:hypothetical protein